MAGELTIRVNGVEYPFPSFDTLTYKEARLIKKETDGLVIGQFYEALEQGDPDALFAIALIARQREGKPLNVDELEGLLLTDIEIVVPQEEAEEPDPASPLDENSAGNAGTTGELLSTVTES